MHLVYIKDRGCSAATPKPALQGLSQAALLTSSSVMGGKPIPLQETLPQTMCLLEFHPTPSP